jgi:hypothetical protein
MAFRSRVSLQASPRLAPTAAILAVAFLTVAMLAAVTSLLGENYRADPPFLDPFRAPTRDEAMLIYPAEYALKSTEYNDVVFLGDSTCRCSIDPAEFQEASGLSAYNLGSMGVLGMDGYRLILQLYLRHHPKPRAVVLAVTPDDFDAEASVEFGATPQRFRWAYGPHWGGSLRLPEDLESVEFFARRGFGVGLTLWENRLAERPFDPRSELLEGGNKYTYLSLERKIRQSRGFWALAGKHFTIGTDAPNKPTVTVATQWDPGVRELAQIADANGIALVIRLVPIVDTVKTDYGPVRTWLSTLPRDCPHLTVIHPDILFYSPDLCWDYQHLNAEGVAAFSRSLGNDVARLLSQEAKSPLEKELVGPADRSRVR